MTQQLYLSPVGILLQQLSNIGQVLAGGLVNIYVAGSVNTPQPTFTDSTGTTLNANPLVLNSAGRLASGNAPVSVWVPANTPHKMVLTDAAGNLLSGGVSMDNLIGIDDPSNAFSALINAGTGFGADLVANAMRSYDVVASVRAANVPVLAAGQTLVIDIEGGALVGDGNGGIFYWSSTSVAVDDGISVIKPTAVIAPAPGRYLRQKNLFGIGQTILLTVQGCTTSPVLSANVVVNGPLVIVSCPGTTPLTSNATSFGFDGFPAGIRDILLGFNSGLIPAEDNGALGISAYLQINNALGISHITAVPNNASGLWTNSGQKQLFGWSFTYIAPNGFPT
jgi:hypothetical protein